MKRSFLAPAIAVAALVSAQAAHAQQACIVPSDLNDTILYAMPLAYDATMTACANRYSDDGFMKAEGPAFADQFRDKQDAAWPGAFRLMKVFATERGKNGVEGNADGLDIGAMFEAMPEESLRPFVDAFVTQMIAGEIKSDSCEKIERGVSLLAPLPAENVSGLVTFIAEVADLKEPQICTDDGVSETESTETAE